MRKTIEVLEILNWANNSLAREDEFATSGFKSGICTMIEKILHSTNNYKGFMFLKKTTIQDISSISDNYYSRFYYINQKLTK
jgi:hypothetical protein